jgi:hypothetical protein
MTTATLAAIGDSQTDYAAGFGNRPTRNWTQVLGTLLTAAGQPAQVRGYGISGDTSTGVLGRADVLQMHETPNVALIHIGVNDPGNSITQATTQANIQAVIKSLKYGAVGAGAGLGTGVSVAGQANLPANGLPGQRYVVLTDTSTTGGMAAWATGQAATITGTVSGSGQAVWEYRYPLAGEYGWGRVATATTAPTNCKRIVVVSTNYLNWTTGGDTLATPYASYVNVRAAQQAAVTAENVTVAGKPSVIYSDVYNFLRSRIVAGTDPDFSAVAYDQTRSWHYVLNNQHKSAYGHALDAQKLSSDILAAWPSLTA